MSSESMPRRRRRICVVITARPSYSRVKSVLHAITASEKLELLVVAAGSALLDRYGRIDRVIEADGFPVVARVYNVVEGEDLTTMARSTGLAIMELANVLGNLNPDSVLTIADRYETIANAIAASYMNIPLIHLQGGEVTGNIDEKVRHAITKLSDLHLVSTQKAGERLLRMGEAEDRVFVTGCPSIDLAAEIAASPELDFDPYSKGGVGKQPDLSRGYLVAMQHPVTTEYQASREHVVETLHAVRDLGIPTLWFWPNVDAGSDGTSKGIRWFREEYEPENIHFFKNLEPASFLRLLCNSLGILGNSSVAIRECSFLGVPAINIGNRQIGRERAGNVIDVADYDRQAIGKALKSLLDRPRPQSSQLYGDGQAGKRIAKVIEGQEAIDIAKMLSY